MTRGFITHLSTLFLQLTPWSVMSVCQEPGKTVMRWWSALCRVKSVAVWGSWHMQVCFSTLVCITWTKLLGTGQIYSLLFSGFAPASDLITKSCFSTHQCVEGSFNLGLVRTHIMSKCCSTDLCNAGSFNGNLLLFSVGMKMLPCSKEILSHNRKVSEMQPLFSSHDSNWFILKYQSPAHNSLEIMIKVLCSCSVSS